MHLLIVEDEQRLARLLQRVLTEERHIVDTAFDGTTGLAMAESTEYDLVVLYLMLPGMSGQAICRTLRTEGIHTPILMLTARGSVEDRVAGLKSGADDYLVKPFAMDEFLARVEAILRRGKLQTEPMEMVIGDLTLDLKRHEARRSGRTIDLTAKEFALLEFLMRHPGQVLTRSQIIDHVWSYDADSLSNVVDIYIHYLRDKIDKGFPKPFIKTIRGVGYRIDA